jgi:hypothetical protein
MPETQSQNMDTNVTKKDKQKLIDFSISKVAELELDQKQLYNANSNVIGLLDRNISKTRNDLNFSFNVSYSDTKKRR